VVVVKRIFDDMAGHLTVHMKKEELMLFPFVRKLARFGGEAMKRTAFETVAEPIRAMMNDHDHEGKKLSELARLTDNFKVPKDGCETFSATYSALEELKTDLHVHIHLENNILFPKAITLESNHKKRLSPER
jgi:regulator of cell morphogenesis and NO signaling